MPQSSPAFVIINPNAGKKLGHSEWPVIQDLLREYKIEFVAGFTERAMDAVRLVQQAVKDGFRHIITIGGDGTFNEVANGILLQQEVPSADVRMSMIPVGTGNDWCRMYRIPGDHRAALRVIVQEKVVKQDVGKVCFTTPDGRSCRYFINIAGMGMDARVVFDTNRRKENGSAGKIAYLLSLLNATFSYRALNASFLLDGEKIFEGPLYSANIGICKFSGGGMQQVPNAIPDDGLFDITIIQKVSKAKVIVNMRRLYNGTLGKMKEVTIRRAEKVVVESNAPILLEADGESLGGPPFEFTLLPAALSVTTA